MAAKRLPSPDPSNPDAIAAHPAWVDYARRIAGTIVRRKGFANYIDDIESAALIGLIQAARSYRSDGGASFKGHAIRRISGAVLDELRAIRCNGFHGMGPSVRRGEFIPVGTLATDGDDETQTPIDIPSGELPIGWEAESEDEVREALRWFGRDGDLAADYFLRADRVTVKRAAAAYGLCESRGSQIVAEVIERVREREQQQQGGRRQMSTNGTVSVNGHYGMGKKPDPGYGTWKDDDEPKAIREASDDTSGPSPPDERKAKNERLSQAMKEAWARRKANGGTSPPRRAKPDLSGIDFSGHTASEAGHDPNRAHAITVAEQPPKPQAPISAPATPQASVDAFDVLSLELDAARAIVNALGPLGADARRRVANWVLGAMSDFRE